MRTPHRLQGLLRVAASLVLAELVCIPVHAQWTKVPSANVPRGPEGKPNLVAPPPRSPDGPPDLPGIWQAEGRYNQNLSKDLKDVPFQPWAKTLADERSTGSREAEDPTA